MKQKLLNQLKKYPLAMVCVALVLVCIVLIIIRGDVAVQLSAQEAELNSRLRVIEQNAMNAKGLEEEVQQLEARVATIKDRLFKSDERAVNTNFFYSFEDQVNIQITRVNQLPDEDPALSPKGPNALKQYSTVVYEINVEGSFAQILNFLYTLHSADPLICVADFHLTEKGSRAKEQSSNLAAKLRVVVLAVKN